MNVQDKQTPARAITSGADEPDGKEYARLFDDYSRITNPVVRESILKLLWQLGTKSSRVD